MDGEQELGLGPSVVEQSRRKLGAMGAPNLGGRWRWEVAAGERAPSPRVRPPESGPPPAPLRSVAASPSGLGRSHGAGPGADPWPPARRGPARVRPGEGEPPAGGERRALRAGAAARTIFVVCFIVTSSLWASAIILTVLAMIVLDMMGVMAILGIQLNAISVVNLVMSIGIAVEFCVHITHAFMIGTGDKETRARQALSTMGASVFSGITLTKLVGVIVLRFAKSEVFVVYYFQMYLALVIIGFLHGLIFLPVLLSLCGPPTKWAKPKEQSQPPSASSERT
ncbi:Patched family protein [Zea mays]|uniref:Patched family protein n=1 Tax=Zea mays TaxID=4577 RepID=A0A1D6JCY6_MAIZE|nr:Patched family protein [Zea mays]